MGGGSPQGNPAGGPPKGSPPASVFYRAPEAVYFCGMDTEFISALSGQVPVLTSSLYSVKAVTDKVRVPVEVVRDPDGEIDVFFSTVLYPHDGVVELSDLGSLIEGQLRAAGRIWDMFEVRIDGVAAEFTAVCCEYKLTDDFDLAKCFLTVSDETVVHRGSPISLNHWPDGSGDYRLQVVGHNADGAVAVWEHTLTVPNDSGSCGFMVDYIIDLATNQTAVETGDVLETVAYFAISHGERQKVFYIVEHQYYLTFWFRNMFNAPEYLDVAGIVTRKTRHDRDTAVCSGRMMQYDQSVERTFEMKTGPLTDTQVRELEQLVGAREVCLCVGREDYEVIITDHTLEYCNDDESLATVSFTFRFASDRVVLTPDDMGALSPVRTGIFSPEYSPEYA